MLQSYIPNNNTTTLVIEDADAAYLLMFSRMPHFEVFDWSKQQSNWINQQWQWIGFKGTPMTNTKNYLSKIVCEKKHLNLDVIKVLQNNNF